MIALLFALACGDPPQRSARVVPVPVQWSEAAIRAETPKLRAGLAQLGGAPKTASSVVMIVLDTTRADLLSAYGGAGLMPQLDAFASESRVYTRMRATAPWTLPAHASLFTGLPSLEHGADGSPPGSDFVAYRLREDVPTLAERLRDAGWTTVGVAANRAFLASEWGLSRGFQLWACERLAAGATRSYVQGDVITALAATALQAAPKDRPLFLFLNFMESHTPWTPRAGFTAHPERINPALLPRGPGWWRAAPGAWKQLNDEILSGARDATAEEQATWREAYAAEARFLDAQLGALFRALQAAGHGPEDYTIILADHGEYLGEHRLIEHSKDLYEPALRVPLILRGPGFEPGVDAGPVTTTDVPEMLLAALGLPPLSAGPLRPALQVAELYWTRQKDLRSPAMRARFDRVRRAFVLGDLKLILSSDGQDEAFDLAADPGERSPLHIDDPRLTALRALAQAWLDARQPGQGEAVRPDADQAERLRALGYLDAEP